MKKVKKIFSIIKQDVLLAKNFGIKVAAIDFTRSLIIRGTSKLGKQLEFYKHENVKKYLLKKYGHIVESYKKVDVNKSEYKIEKDSPIWIFWWQGIDEAPDIVKKCVESIRQHAGSHPVNIVTKYNYNEYVQIPKYIIDKLERNCMTITHFSDILRMQLIYTHGGIWMDATLYLTGNISDELCNYDFYTIRHGLLGDYHVCKGLWTGFFLAGNKGNVAFKYFSEMFFEYWKNENTLICYLLIDCIMALGYENMPFIREMVDSVPKNNTKVFQLQDILGKEYSSELYESLVQDTKINKVTYKIQFPNIKNGNNTFYYYLINNLY